MKKKYKNFIKKARKVFTQKKITGNGFPVAKYWKVTLTLALVMFTVFVGVGVYAYYSLEFMRQDALANVEHHALVSVPDEQSVEYMVTHYRVKVDSYINTISHPPETPGLGLVDVTVEEEVIEEVVDGESVEEVEAETTEGESVEPITTGS